MRVSAGVKVRARAKGWSEASGRSGRSAADWQAGRGLTQLNRSVEGWVGVVGGAEVRWDGRGLACGAEV